ncbi:MAG: HD domain-containing protein [Prevotella sp.]|nr:HD domain-containing protein [Staphylococcus sp.]MCM1349584.1 HD domain-containing protein [Prevotella sp.]
MRVKEEKIFMDSVHGYISIPKCFVKYIIDTAYFQRLRNIDQTGMRILFPNAKHDRFSHSLGVFYLGRKAVSALWNNSRQMIVEKSQNTQNEKFNKEDWICNEVLFLLACLLHDIGHTPFSHALEDLVFENTLKELDLDIDEELKKKLYGTANHTNPIQAASHEKMGAYLLFNAFFSKQIENVLVDLSKEEYYKGIFAHSGRSIQDNLEDYLCFMARMILGLPYDIEENASDAYGLRNCFIELLNSPNFDVDNLDYIVRDTQMSGIQNITVDIERLFHSLCIVTKTSYCGIKMQSGFTAPLKETIVEGKNTKSQKLKVKGNFVGAILIHPETKIVVEKGSYFSSLMGHSNNSVRISMDSNECAQFASYTDIEIDSEKINIASEENSNKKIYPQNNRNSFYCKIENAEIITDFAFTTKEEVILTFKNECTLQINGAFQVVSSISVQNVEVFPNSYIDEIVILDKKENTNHNLANHKRIEYAIGFRKQAINVIANVLEARNYLYLWIYAHHKVVYYANFLIPVLAKEIFSFDLSSKIWNLEYNSLKYLDDIYFWTIIKEIDYSQNTILSKDSQLKKEIGKLIQELMERKYKYSLYKSLAEFDLFFEQTTNEQMTKIVNILRKQTDEAMPHLCQRMGKAEDKEYIAGYVDNTFIEKINYHLQDKFPTLRLRTLLYVFVEYKMKTLKTEKIYINMGDKVVTMSDIHLLEKQSKANEDHKNYFYLYYEIEEIQIGNEKNESEEIEIKINGGENNTTEEPEKTYKIELGQVIRNVLTDESKNRKE